MAIQEYYASVTAAKSTKTRARAIEHVTGYKGGGNHLAFINRTDIPKR